MKTLSLVYCSIALFLAPLPLTPLARAAQDSPYAVVERGPHHRVWERTEHVLSATGRSVPRVHSYIELATGMHYLKDGQWLEAQETIEAFPGGAVARQGQTHVIFANNLATAGAIELQTPDGKRLVSHVIGLSYFDTATGKNILFAEVKDCQGILTASNQVLYEHAFTDIDASVRYTYTRSSFEQDIVVHSQLPPPEDFNLNSSSCVLQLITEFISPPQPAKAQILLRSESGVDVLDEDLDFGALKIGRGRAFSLGTTAAARDVPVCKQWLNIDGRDLLIEQVPLPDLQTHLRALPKAEGASVEPRTNATRRLASVKRILPARPLAKTTSRKMQVASLVRPLQGLVLDYATMAFSATNYLFTSDTNYYISGTVNLRGTNVWEGGSVCKFSTNASINVSQGPTASAVEFRTHQYRPVVFTAKDDDSVGEPISGSTGTPSGYYADPALALADAGSPTVQNVRFAYARRALSLYHSGLSLYHAQIRDCQTGIECNIAGVSCRNVLFSNLKTNFNFLTYGSASAENATFSTSAYLGSSIYAGQSLVLTNCILANVTNLAGGGLSLAGAFNGFFNTTSFGNNPSSVTEDPFQTAAAGFFYLRESSSFRNLGTTNLNATLRADLTKRTTYPPLVIAAATWNTIQTLFPQSQRDTDLPDLGYHYDPIDFLLGGVLITNATVSVSAGTVMGAFGTNLLTYGLGLLSGSSLVCSGSATAPCRIVEYSTVQDHPGSPYLKPSYGMICDLQGSPAAFNLRFTDFSALAQDVPHLTAWNTPLAFQHCQFHGGLLQVCSEPQAMTNCLLERVNAQFYAFYGLSVPVIRNNTLFGGTFDFMPLGVNNAILKDNLFDRTLITTDLTGWGYDGGYNAFVTNCSRQLPTFATDLILPAPPDYQSSYLGNYYLPTNSPLIDAGSTTANLVGLYHFTTTTNQLKEITSTADIGFHLVATDSSGKPIDTDGDGYSDVQEDVNGDGLATGDPTSWTTYNSPNGLGTAPFLIFTPLK